jgi:hypothetical protein
LVEWLAGNRIKGTSTERTAGTPEVPEVPAISGGWKEIGRASVTSGDTINVTSLADKKYLMVLGCGIGSGNVALISRFNSDTGNNYNNRYNSNGGTDATSGTNDRLFTNGSGSSPQEFSVFYVANKSNKEKLLVGHNVNNASTGANNLPQRREYANKWANTSSAISSLNVFNSDSGDFASGSEVVVLGYDPDDTHTTNFWEQLANVTTSSSADFFSSGTITAKKYLWVQAYVKQASPYSTGLQFNSDTANNYAVRFSGNGNSDSTAGTNTWKCAMNYSSLAGGGYFMNAFIINNASKEKLVIAQTSENSSTGAGTAPNRLESAGKWANTSDQITSIQIRKESGAGGGQIQSGSFIKVWGSN